MRRVLTAGFIVASLAACGGGSSGGSDREIAAPGSFEWLDWPNDGHVRLDAAVHTYDAGGNLSEVFAVSDDGWKVWIYWDGPDPYGSGPVLIRIEPPSTEIFDSQAESIAMDGEPWADDPDGRTSGTFSADFLGGSPPRPMTVTGGRFSAVRIP